MCTNGLLSNTDGVFAHYNENGEKEITQEYLAAQTFESLADTVPLDAMMDNGEMVQRGINEGI